MCDLQDDISTSDVVSLCSVNTEYLERELTNQRQAQLHTFESLSKKLSNFHPSVLFCRFGDTKSEVSYKAYDSLVKSISGCDDDSVWRLIGEAYGVEKRDLDIINNHTKWTVNNVDVLLKVVTVRNENATIDKLLDVLYQNKIYSVLDSVSNSMERLKEEFEKDEGYHSGYITNSASNDNTSPIISIKPTLLEHIISNNVPNILIQDYKCDRDREIKPLFNTDAKRDSLVLFLTFAEDGIELANDIKRKVDNWKRFVRPVSVWTLSGYGGIQDPNGTSKELIETMIRNYCIQADLIVPIITEGYRKEINRETNLYPTSEFTDCKYVQYINKILENKYIEDSCKNTKVRSVITNTNMARDVPIHLKPCTVIEKFEFFKVYLKNRFDERQKDLTPNV